MVHFIMISTEHDLSPGTRQYKWLEQDLKSIDRSKTPWVIIGGHRPMYTSEIDPGKNEKCFSCMIIIHDKTHTKLPLLHVPHDNV